MITRSEAVACVLSLLSDELVVAANGMISRETFLHGDREANFYMLGSMGLASAIGLGIAVSQPKHQVVVLDGDGNVLMGLATLAMVGELSPRNFLHIVFDNEVYGSTGGQRSISDRVALEKLATAAGYVRVARAESYESLMAAAQEMMTQEGPSFLLVKVGQKDLLGIPRVYHSPEEISARFRKKACR